MTQTNKYDILSNEFSINVLRLSSVALRNIEKKNKQNLGNKLYVAITPVESYLVNVAQLQSRIHKVFNQLHHVRVFLQRYPLKEFYLDNDISQLDYIQYHEESMIHKVHTILEIMKLLINEVYKLGLNPKDCSWILLKKTIRTSEIPMVIVNDFFKKFTKIIDFRHLNTHRGYYKDKEMDEIDLFFGVTLSKFERDDFSLEDKFWEKVPPKIAKHFIRDYRKRKIGQVDEVIDNANDLLKKFLESLNTPFLDRLSEEKYFN